MPGLLESLGMSVYVSYVLRLHGLLEAAQSIVDGIPLVGRNLVTVIPEVLLGLEAESIGIVDLVNPLPLGLVGCLIGLGLVTHPLDLALGKVGRSLDADLLLLAGSLVLCGNIEDTVGVDVESHLDLRDSPRSRCDSVKMEETQLLVVLGHRALTLENLDFH